MTAASAGWSVLVCAGGAARRLSGQDKPGLVVGGSTLLERVLAAAAGAERRVVVGPRRVLAAGPGAPVDWRQDDPPGGGPVAAIATGLTAISTPFVAVLAADLPFLTDRELELLRRGAEPPATDVAVLVDPRGRRQYLAAVWRTARLRAALPTDPAGQPVRSLFAGRAVREIPAGARACLDCDEPGDVELARRWAARPGQAGHHGTMPSPDSPSAGGEVVDRPSHDHVAAPRRDAAAVSNPSDSGGVLGRWVVDVCAELGLDAAGIDVTDLLDLTRDVAHGVARPAAPLTAFLVGLAAGRDAAAPASGGTAPGPAADAYAAAVRAAADAVRGLLGRRASGPDQPIRPGPASSR
jgi:molybdopterin-guanine dinucleotide biosynthesis protein A